MPWLTTRCSGPATEQLEAREPVVRRPLNGRSLSRGWDSMFRWFRRKRDVSRCAGRTASEWYLLHRYGQHPNASWSASLAQAVREITAADGDQRPARVIDVLVTDSSEAARCVAAIQLCIDRPPDTDIALRAALQDESELVRRTAAVSFVEIGSVRGLAAVVAGSGHGCAVRTHAAFKLAKMKTGEAAEAVPALMILLQYPYINWRTHWAAVDALCAIGDAAVPSLVNALHHGSAQMRYYAAIALQQIGKTPELLSLIEEEIRKDGLGGKDDEAESIGRSAAG
jgi:HEAT repeat protein